MSVADTAASSAPIGRSSSGCRASRCANDRLCAARVAPRDGAPVGLSSSVAQAGEQAQERALVGRVAAASSAVSAPARARSTRAAGAARVGGRTRAARPPARRLGRRPARARRRARAGGSGTVDWRLGAGRGAVGLGARPASGRAPDGRDRRGGRRCGGAARRIDDADRARLDELEQGVAQLDHAAGRRAATRSRTVRRPSIATSSAPALAVDDELVDAERRRAGTGRQSSDGITASISRHCFEQAVDLDERVARARPARRTPRRGLVGDEPERAAARRVHAKQTSTSRVEQRGAVGRPGRDGRRPRPRGSAPSSRWTTCRRPVRPRATARRSSARSPSSPSTSGSDNVSNVPWSTRIPPVTDA